MDKLAQKFSAQEMIKANSQAEAEELQRLQLQVYFVYFVYLDKLFYIVNMHIHNILTLCSYFIHNSMVIFYYRINYNVVFSLHIDKFFHNSLGTFLMYRGTPHFMDFLFL